MGSKRDNEEAWFAKVNAERRQAIRAELEQKALALQAREDINTALDMDDAALAESIRVLGFDGDTARAFDLLPLVLVSWADGTVQAGERRTILGALSERGLEPGCEAWLLMESLLEEHPPTAYIDECVAVLRVLKSRHGGGADVVDLCMKVAEASGGLLGLGSVSQNERAALQGVAVALGGDAEKKFQALLG